VAIGSELDESGMSVTVRALVAYACAEAGEYERCLELMRSAGAPGFRSFFAAQKAPGFEAMSSASLELGRGSEAEEWAGRAEASADEAGLPGALAAARRARARVLLAGDEPGVAAELTLEAAAELDRAGSRLDAARTRVLAGRALGAAGSRTRAIEELKRAHVELGECGAAGYCDHAARELRRLGHRMPRTAPRRVTSSGVKALSDREREIADLVALAKTNREIATTLFISEKTVEKHLTKVFAKLGVKGRAAVGGKLAARDEPQT
jgi:DNA-binding CsgD family transcriptional regulator